MKTLLTLILSVACIWAADDSETFRARFETRFAAAQERLRSPVRTPGDELRFLEAEAGVMAAYSAWMAAENRDVTAALDNLDGLRRRSAGVDGRQVELSAARLKSAQILATAQSAVARVRDLAIEENFIDAGASLSWLDTEIQALDAAAKSRGANGSALDDIGARLTWHAWWLKEQSDSSAALEAIYESREARIRLSSDHDEALKNLSAMQAEWRTRYPGAEGLRQMAEWCAVEDSSGRQLDPKKIAKEAKRVLERKY